MPTEIDAPVGVKGAAALPGLPGRTCTVVVAGKTAATPAGPREGGENVVRPRLWAGADDAVQHNTASVPYDTLGDKYGHAALHPVRSDVRLRVRRPARHRYPHGRRAADRFDRLRSVPEQTEQ